MPPHINTNENDQDKSHIPSKPTKRLIIEKPMELTFDAADDDVNEFLPNKSLESKTTNENSLSLGTTEEQNLWLASLNLNIHDKEIILNDDWLND